MAKLSPEQFQEKHARRLKESIPDMRAGVERVTVSPTAQAAKKLDKLKANLIKAIDSGKMKRRMEAVTVEDWRSKMLTKGLNRVATGIDEAAPKVVKFAGKLLPFIDKVQAEVKKMPDLTLEDNINRAAQMMRGMAKFQND